MHAWSQQIDNLFKAEEELLDRPFFKILNSSIVRTDMKLISSNAMQQTVFTHDFVPLQQIGTNNFLVV